MLAIDKVSDAYLYRQVADLVAAEVETGALRPGDRLPSLRRMSANLGVSIPTVKQAYLELERQGKVNARPQSGFYVQAQVRNAPVRQSAAGWQDPVEVCCRSLIEQVYDAIHRPQVIPFGIANPSMARPAAKMLHRTMKRVMARAEERSLSYAPMLGDPGLRRQIAYRYLDFGGRVAPEEVIITNGGQEALALALQAVARAGDVIAVESPTYSGMLELIESLGMLAMQIETCPQSGVSLRALEQALDRRPVRACLFSSSLNNPLGSLTSDEDRQALVALLEARGVVLIEDDVYGDLVFGSRPKPAQFYSRRSMVLTCGSFSKTAAPGYRIGWVLPGRFREPVSRLKRSLSCSSGLLQQLTLSEFISSGDYERHLKALRPVLKCNSERMSALVGRCFPADTRVSQPRGGSVLWLELPGKADSERLFKLAMDENISISPGIIYAPDERYRGFIRLSFGHPWDERLEQGVERLGALLRRAG